MTILTYPHFQTTFPRSQWTLPFILEYQALHRAEKPFLSWTDANPALSYAEVNARVNQLAHSFQALGIKRGERVCILLPNCLEYCLSWFALCKLGAIEVCVSDAYLGNFLAHPINLAGSQTIITTAKMAERLVDIESDIPTKRLLIVNIPDEAGMALPRFKRMETIPFDSVYSANRENPPLAVTPEDVAAVLFTSGTTGPSKGVVMPHSQFYFFAEEDLQLTRLTENDVYMTGFPLFHGNAQFLTVYPCMIAGAHCVLYPRFSASDWSGRARRSGATVTNLLGATMAFICAQPLSPDDRAHKVTRIYAAPLAVDLAGKFTERFGVQIYVDGFGQTEISNIFMTPWGAKRPPGASGVLVDQWFDIKLADPESGEAVPEGEVGELLIRHKVPGTISNEYLGMPDKTIESRRDLWFHTGDALRRDAEGWYYFVDRVKDALRRRGENISSFEVEAVLRAHPAVVDCAVIGVKADEAAGEDEVMGFLVLEEGKTTVDFAEISAWCDARMPAFMVPRYLEVIPQLPRTPTEKVQKKLLRERGIGKDAWDRVKSGYKPAVAKAR